MTQTAEHSAHGVWTHPANTEWNVNMVRMTVTKHRVLAKMKEVLGLLTHHPLETKTAKELFQSMVFP